MKIAFCRSSWQFAGMTSNTVHRGWILTDEDEADLSGVA